MKQTLSLIAELSGADSPSAKPNVIIFLTDNGTAQGEKVFNAGMRGKEGTPYEGGHRVACFLHWPAGGFDKQIKVNRLTAHLDLLPTLVDLCTLRLPKPIQFDGDSLKPLLTDPPASSPERTLVLGAPRNETGPNPPPPKYGQGGAVMTDRWRWVTDRELDDLTTDPGQQYDVARENAPVVKALHDAYDGYWASVSARDEGWRGRPIIGSSHAPEVGLCAEDWYSAQGIVRGTKRRWPGGMPCSGAGLSASPNPAPISSKSGVGRARRMRPWPEVPPADPSRTRNLLTGQSVNSFTFRAARFGPCPWRGCNSKWGRVFRKPPWKAATSASPSRPRLMPASPTSRPPRGTNQAKHSAALLTSAFGNHHKPSHDHKTRDNDTQLPAAASASHDPRVGSAHITGQA